MALIARGAPEERKKVQIRRSYDNSVPLEFPEVDDLKAPLQHFCTTKLIYHFGRRYFFQIVNAEVCSFLLLSHNFQSVGNVFNI